MTTTVQVSTMRSQSSCSASCLPSPPYTTPAERCDASGDGSCGSCSSSAGSAKNPTASTLITPPTRCTDTTDDTSSTPTRASHQPESLVAAAEKAAVTMCDHRGAMPHVAEDATRPDSTPVTTLDSVFAARQDRRVGLQSKAVVRPPTAPENSVAIAACALDTERQRAVAETPMQSCAYEKLVSGTGSWIGFRPHAGSPRPGSMRVAPRNPEQHVTGELTGTPAQRSVCAT